MQGTGTQTDPYIPESWADFVTAMETNDAYIEVPKNTVYDMSLEYTAYMPTINVRCSRVLGNGVILRNLMEPKFKSARLNSGNTTTLYNMIFEKIVKTGVDGMFEYSSGNINICDSEFYGMFPFHSPNISPPGILSNTSDYWTLYRCSGNIELTIGNGDRSTFRLAGRVTDCNFTIRLPDNYVWNTTSILLPASSNGGMTGSVIQYEGSNRPSLTSAYVNAENTHDDIIVYPGGWAAVYPPSGQYVATEDQYKSAEWLRSKGFSLPFSEVS